MSSTLITGVVCYVLGLLVGVLTTRATFGSRVEAAYQRGKKETQDETDRATEDLTDKLQVMRESLLSTFDAYHNAVQVVEDRLRPGTAKQVALHFESESLQQIEYRPPKDKARVPGSETPSPDSTTLQESGTSEASTTTSTKSEASSPDAETASTQPKAPAAELRSSNSQLAEQARES